MATSLFSPSWYRVAELKPRLRQHVEIHRHEYRGRVWHLLQDRASGRSHRLSPAAFRLVGLMDGARSVQRLWDLANEQLGGRAPTQDETIRLLGQLHAADALICDVPPDGRELFRRFQRAEGQKLKQKVWSPLAIRVPLWDPDRFLDRTAWLVAPLFTLWGFLAWLALVAAGGVLTVTHFAAITENLADRALTVENLAVLWLVYPMVKAIHELGHAYAVKLRGGEVHEIGVMILMLIPVPYVDASDAIGFPEKRDRMLVGAVGIMVEMALASLALLVWLNAEPGAVRAVAYNTMLIGGISTLLFNGNPLLRFDGYYVLADWIEIPNLGSRANRHLGYVVQRYAFGAKDAEPVTTLAGERIWFVLYGIAAFVYRLLIMAAIILYIAGQFFVIGVLLALWALTTQAVVPVAKAVHTLATSHRLRSNRPRAVLVTLGFVAGLGALLFLVPFPHRTMAEAVTWPAERSQLRAGADGFVAELLARNRAAVVQGAPVVALEDPLLDARARLLRARIHALDVEEAAVGRQDRVQAQVLREEIAAARAELERIETQIADLVAHAPRDGVVVMPNDADLIGRFVRKGALLGYVVDDGDTLALRLVVDQDRVGLVRSDVEAIEVMAPSFDARPVPARLLRETPGGALRLPTAALGSLGGGAIPVDPRDPDGVRTLERVFEFELVLPEGEGTAFLGRRVAVKIDHGFEPLGFQLWRSVRQLFLRLYGV